MTTDELKEALQALQAAAPVVQQTMNFNAPIGQQIAHVDKIEAHFDKDMGMTIASQQPAPNGQQPGSADDLAEQLMPLFKHDQEVVAQFLADISGATPSGITRLVNEYVAQRKLLDWAKKSPLWRVLHDHGVYSLTESNWNKRVV